MDNIKEVVKLLEQQVINKTLSLDGISQVQSIIDENEELEKTLVSKDARLKVLRDSLDDHLYKLDKHLAELDILRKRNAELEAKELQYQTNAMEAKYLNLRASEMREIVDLALRNPVITRSRETMTNVVTPMSDNGYRATTTPVFDTETTIEEKK